jgi:hypothetical protein
MTKEQLDAIREHVSFDDVSIHDVIPLLAEVERLTKREDVLVKAGLDLMVANRDLTAERDAAFRRTAEAFQRGVEKMREEIALLFDGGPNVAGLATLPAWRDFIRELATPEDIK